MVLSKDQSKDFVKNLLLIPKLILEGLSLWPENDGTWIKFINYFLIINLSLMELGHLSYMLVVITNISKMATTCTTVSATFQTILKVACLRYYKRDFNHILNVVRREFWSTDLASNRTRNMVKTNVNFVRFTCTFYLVIALISVTQFLSYPMIIGNESLPLASLVPFDSFKNVPFFEMMYLWQYFNGYINVCTISGYDFMVSGIAINVVAQFQILQDALHNIGKEDCSESSIKNRRSFLKRCVIHHKRLLTICEKLNDCTTLITFIQFFVSSLALCVSCLVITQDPKETSKMVPFVMAHLLQLFILCSIGSELINQSVLVADAAVECGYQNEFDKSVRQAIVMMVQRSQRKVRLTALGFTELSYESFVMLLRTTFSFYTMLDSFK